MLNYGAIVVRPKCPTCKKSGDWFAGRYGPFCSERCKLVDLGKWFSEEHLIFSPVRHEDLDNLPTQEPETTQNNPMEAS